jgi:hypothetical protein
MAAHQHARCEQGPRVRVIGWGKRNRQVEGRGGGLASEARLKGRWAHLAKNQRRPQQRIQCFGEQNAGPAQSLERRTCPNTSCAVSVPARMEARSRATKARS